MCFVIFDSDIRNYAVHESIKKRIVKEGLFNIMDKKQLLENTDLFVLDMDGTFYLGDNILPGALSFIDAVKQKGKDYLFFTNNASTRPEAYIDKLAGMGCFITRDKIMTSGDVMIRFLQSKYPGKSVYLQIGRASCRERVYACV